VWRGELRIACVGGNGTASKTGEFGEGDNEGGKRNELPIVGGAVKFAKKYISFVLEDND